MAHRRQREWTAVRNAHSTTMEPAAARPRSTRRRRLAEQQNPVYRFCGEQANRAGGTSSDTHWRVASLAWRLRSRARRSFLSVSCPAVRPSGAARQPHPSSVPPCGSAPFPAPRSIESNRITRDSGRPRPSFLVLASLLVSLSLQFHLPVVDDAARSWTLDAQQTTAGHLWVRSHPSIGGRWTMRCDAQAAAAARGWSPARPEEAAAIRGVDRRRIQPLSPQLRIMCVESATYKDAACRATRRNNGSSLLRIIQSRRCSFANHSQTAATKQSRGRTRFPTEDGT